MYELMIWFFEHLSLKTFFIVLFILFVWDLWKYINLYLNWINDFKNNTRNCAYGKGNINQPHLTLHNKRFFVVWMCPSLPSKKHPGLTVLQEELTRLQFFDECIYKWYDGPSYFVEFAISSNGQFKLYYDNLCSFKKINMRWLYEFILKKMIDFCRFIISLKIPKVHSWKWSIYKTQHKIIYLIILKFRNKKAKKLWKKHKLKWDRIYKEKSDKFWGNI